MYGRNIRKPGDYADDELKLWFHRLERGIKRRRLEYKQWDKNEDYENLKMWPEEIDESLDAISINKVGSWINTRLANILYRNPRPVVRPVRDRDYTPETVAVLDPKTGQVVEEAIPRYKVVENVLSFVVGRPSFGLNRTLRRFAKAGYINYGVVKSGYSPSFEYVPVEVDPVIPGGPDGLPDLSGFVTDEAGNLVLENGRPIRRELSTEKWFCDWVDARHMIIDPDGSNEFYDHAWVAQEIVRSLEDVKADTTLKNTKDLRATGYTKDPEDEDDEDDAPSLSNNANDPALKEEEECVRLFEIIDLSSQELIVLADGYGKYLRRDPLPLGISHSPYVFFRPQEILGEFYPRPKLTDLVPINEEYNVARQQWMLGARRGARKYLFDSTRLDEKIMEKLKGPEDQVFVPVQGAVDQGMIIPVPMTPLSNDLYNQVLSIKTDFDEVSGQAGEARGVASAKTATQVNELQRYSTAREDDDRQQLADAVREIFKKLLDSLQANLSRDLAVAIEGSDGRLFIFSANREMIAGDFDVDVDVTDMMPRNRDIEKAQFTEVLQVAAQAPWLFADPAVAGAILDMFGIRNTTVRDGIVRVAQMQMQAMAGPPPGQAGPGPGAGVPPDVQTMLAQQGGAMAGGH